LKPFLYFFCWKKYAKKFFANGGKKFMRLRRERKIFALGKIFGW